MLKLWLFDFWKVGIFEFHRWLAVEGSGVGCLEFAATARLCKGRLIRAEGVTFSMHEKKKMVRWFLFWRRIWCGMSSVDLKESSLS